MEENEIIERICEVFSELSKEDFTEETNRILGTSYSVDDIEWDT